MIGNNYGTLMFLSLVLLAIVEMNFDLGPFAQYARYLVMVLSFFAALWIAYGFYLVPVGG